MRAKTCSVLSSKGLISFWGFVRKKKVKDKFYKPYRLNQRHFWSTPNIFWLIQTFLDRLKITKLGKQFWGFVWKKKLKDTFYEPTVESDNFLVIPRGAVGSKTAKTPFLPWFFNRTSRRVMVVFPSLNSWWFSGASLGIAQIIFVWFKFWSIWGLKPN